MQTPDKKSYRNYYVAFVAGVLGATVMAILMSLARATGHTRLNLEMMLGSILTGNMSTGTWIIGFFWQLINGGLFALIYAEAFNRIKKANGLLGIGIGGLHWVMAGIFIGITPMVHPMIPEVMQAPGYFAANGGAFDLLALLVIHLVFGGIVGYIYGRSRSGNVSGHFPHSEEHRHETSPSYRT